MLVLFKKFNLVWIAFVLLLPALVACSETSAEKSNNDAGATQSVKEQALGSHHTRSDSASHSTYQSIGIFRVYDAGAMAKLGSEFVFDGQIVNEGTALEILADGFIWSEGPLWVEKTQCLIFSDIPNNRVNQYCPANNGDGALTVYLANSGKSNGLAFDHQGKLLLMQGELRQVGLMDAALSKPQSLYEAKATHFEGKRFNSPNDLTVSRSGEIYFTDPPYGLKGGLDDPAKELPFQGVYKLNPSSGKLMLLDDQLTYPNGIALAEGEKQLVVAVSDPERPAWYRYDINEDGTLENRKLMLDARDYQAADPAYQQGLPDGLKRHSSGVFFATGPGGVWIFDINGTLLARIMVPNRPVANIAFNADQSAIYLTAASTLQRVELGP